MAKLRQADVLIGQGKNVPDGCKEPVQGYTSDYLAIKSFYYVPLFRLSVDVNGRQEYLEIVPNSDKLRHRKLTKI